MSSETVGPRVVGMTIKIQNLDPTTLEKTNPTPTPTVEVGAPLNPYWRVNEYYYNTIDKEDGTRGAPTIIKSIDQLENKPFVPSWKR